jgi:hypothetical protein
MRYAHSELIEVWQARKKGRGVFARKSIRHGTVIERVPVVVMRVQEVFSNAPRTEKRGSDHRLRSCPMGQVLARQLSCHAPDLCPSLSSSAIARSSVKPRGLFMISPLCLLRSFAPFN